MSTLTDRDRTALVVIDMQQAVVANGHEVERVVANIDTLITRARSGDTSVIWVQHADDEMPSGSAGWEFVPELAPASGESIIAKRFGDSFEETELESTLSDLGVGRLIVTGAQTDACVRSTLHGAVARGYDTVLVGDAHTTEDMREWGSPLSPEQAIAYTNMYWNFTAAPGRTCATVTTDEVDFAS
jgi:nicotinamidase-related amidase